MVEKQVRLKDKGREITVNDILYSRDVYSLLNENSYENNPYDMIGVLEIKRNFILYTHKYFYEEYLLGRRNKAQEIRPNEHVLVVFNGKHENDTDIYLASRRQILEDYIEAEDKTGEKAEKYSDVFMDTMMRKQKLNECLKVFNAARTDIDNLRIYERIPSYIINEPIKNTLDPLQAEVMPNLCTKILKRYQKTFAAKDLNNNEREKYLIAI